MSLKIAVVGTGRVAKRNYLPFLAKQEDVSITYFSRTRAKAEACAEEFGGNVLDSLEEVAAHDPDSILVLTNEEQRFNVAMSLLEHRPRRLFFEKPLVAQEGQNNVIEDDFFKGRSVLQKAGDTGTDTAMIFNYRFFEQVQRAKRIVEERNLGKLVQATALVHYACWSHCIDLLQVFAGQVSDLTSLRGTRTHSWAGTETADIAAAFRTEGGAAGTVLGTCAMRFQFPLFEITLSFEEGRISLRDLDTDMEVLDYSGKRHESYALIRSCSRTDQLNGSFARSIGAYLDSIRNNEPPPVPGIAGLQELQFEAALKRSAAEKRPVSLQEDFPLDL